MCLIRCWGDDCQSTKRRGEAVWDRLARQAPGCRFCELDLTCKTCNIGSCGISLKEHGSRRRGIYADADVIAARSVGRFIIISDKA